MLPISCRALIAAMLLCGGVQTAAAAKFDNSGLTITRVLHDPQTNGILIRGATASPGVMVREEGADKPNSVASDANGAFQIRPRNELYTTLATNSGKITFNQNFENSLKRELTCRAPSDYFSYEGKLTCIPRCLTGETGLMGRVETKRVSDGRIVDSVTEGPRRLTVLRTLDPPWEGDGVAYPMQGPPATYYQEGWIYCFSPVLEDGYK